MNCNSGALSWMRCDPGGRHGRAEIQRVAVDDLRSKSIAMNDPRSWSVVINDDCSIQNINYNIQ